MCVPCFLPRLMVMHAPSPTHICTLASHMHPCLTRAPLPHICMSFHHIHTHTHPCVHPHRTLTHTHICMLTTHVHTHAHQSPHMHACMPIMQAHACLPKARMHMPTHHPQPGPHLIVRPMCCRLLREGCCEEAQGCGPHSVALRGVQGDSHAALTHIRPALTAGSRQRGGRGAAGMMQRVGKQP